MLLLRHPMLLYLCLIFGLIAMCSAEVAAPLEADESLFSGVASPIESLTPLPTDAEVAAQRAAELEALKPAPLVKRDIPQRVEQVSEDVFMILPREAPLPVGTISGGFFIEESGEAPVFPVASEVVSEVARDVSGSVAGAEGVLIPKAGGGYAVATKKEVKSTPPEQAQKPKKKEHSKQVKKKAPARQILTAELLYDLDFDLSEDNAPLLEMIKALKGKTVQNVQFVVRGTPPPLVDYAILTRHRVRTLLDFLPESVDKGKVQTIVLTTPERAAAQKIEVRVMYKAPTVLL